MSLVKICSLHFIISSLSTNGCLFVFEGAERLVKHLHKNGVPIATATGSHTQSFELKTSGHKDLFSLFHHCVLSGDDPECKHGKPAPDCFLLAAQRFPDNPDPSKVKISSTYVEIVCINAPCTTLPPSLLFYRCWCLRMPPMEWRLLMQQGCSVCGFPTRASTKRLTDTWLRWC